MSKILITFLIINLYSHLVANKARAIAKKNDFFLSMVGFENLFETEVQLFTKWQNYISNLQQHIDVLKSQMKFIQREHNVATRDLESYLQNPINAYRLIRRLFTDWPSYEEFVATDATVHTNYLRNLKVVKQNLSFPTEDDLIGSTLALERLQETYQLDVSQMAKGILNAVKYGPSMSWKDCYLVGEYLFALQNYKNAIPWLKQASKILMSSSSGDASLPMTLSNLEIMAEYIWKVGEFKSALELIDYVLQHDEKRQSAWATKMYLKKLIDNGVVSKNFTKPVSLNSKEYQLFKLYERVCRGEVKSSKVQHKRQLFCKYHNKHHPYRLLQPFKLEQLSIDPYLIIVHDIINDYQMEAMRKIAQPVLKRSRVLSNDGHGEVDNQRTSKTVWFNYTDHSFTIQWLRHVNHLTSLNTENAEPLQVINYGLGGHYGPHIDFYPNNGIHMNNRIATAIFYLSDVEEGGGTAFPFLNILVKPRKGAMLFWYNLHPSGDGDYRTTHASCPVIVGSKWIATIWLKKTRSVRQETV